VKHRQQFLRRPPPQDEELPSLEDELSHYGYSFANENPQGKQSNKKKVTTTTTTTTTTTEAPTPPPPTLSPNYRQRKDGRIIDFYADPNFPRELKNADLTDYPFYVSVPENIVFDCDKYGDVFFASIPHHFQLFHYCFGGYRYDFLCPNYTLYDQTTFTCRFINTVDCEKSTQYYQRNDALFKETTTEGPTTTTTTTTTTQKPTTTTTTTTTTPLPLPRKPSKGKKHHTTSTTTQAPEDEYYDDYYEDEASTTRAPPAKRTTTTSTTTTTTTTSPRPFPLSPRRIQRPRLTRGL